MRLILTDAADRDLEQIGDYIAEESPMRAVTFLKELRTACRGLTEAPLRFAVLDGFAHRGFRRRIYGRYAIVYSVGRDEITILRVLSLAMDLSGALGGN